MTKLVVDDERSDLNDLGRAGKVRLTSI
jgi:hypothetical protein